LYYSKLLLFGEHTVVKGSRALAVPYARYSGKWSFEEHKNQRKSADALRSFCDHLMQHESLLHQFNLTQFSEDLKRGLWFDSNIPTGYGLGSSGSVCAAVYDRYGVDKLDKKKAASLSGLKSTFAQMESYFHGSSSGTDPLICYLNKAVILQKNDLNTVSLLRLNEGKSGMFLLNTHIPRKTGPLVRLFLDKCENPAFNQLIENELALYTDNCINAFLQKNTTVLFDNLRKLSDFQYQYLPEMIPEKFRKIWLDGLTSGDYILKLCGAGGGGFMLGFTEDIDALHLNDVEIAYRF